MWGKGNLASSIFPEPAKYGRWVDDRDQILKQGFELLAANESLSLGRCEDKSLGQLTAEDFIFDLKEVELTGEFFLRAGGYGNEEGLEEVGHRDDRDSRSGAGEQLHTGTARERMQMVNPNRV